MDAQILDARFNGLSAGMRFALAVQRVSAGHSLKWRAQVAFILGFIDLWSRAEFAQTQSDSSKVKARWVTKGSEGRLMKTR